MPKPSVVNQKKKENKEQKMPQKPETIFHQKIYNECIFKILRIAFHTFQLFYITAKIRYNVSFN
jgi:hypothetical protein